MSVPKSKQTLSDMEFYHTANWLRRKIEFYLLRDFGIKDKIRSVELFKKAKNFSDEDSKTLQELSEKYDIYNPLVEVYPQWYLDSYRNSIIALLRSLIDNIRRANRINAQTVEQFERRRSYQDKAIGDCEVLYEEFQHVTRMLPVNIEKYEEIINKIDFEIQLLSGWRKSDNRILSAIKKKVSQQEKTHYLTLQDTLCTRCNWWLSAVANSSNFCKVNNNGNADYNNAGNSNGVRPITEPALCVGFVRGGEKQVRKECPSDKVNGNSDVS